MEFKKAVDITKTRYDQINHQFTPQLNTHSVEFFFSLMPYDVNHKKKRKVLSMYSMYVKYVLSACV